MDIFTACREGDARYVRKFLDNISNDVNEGDDHGFTPLHMACREGHFFIVQMLVGRGARVSVKNDGGDSALHLASNYGNMDVVLYLLKRNANTNVANEHGNTPLHYACFQNYENVAVQLVRQGAHISQCNRYDETPFDKAKPELKKLLREIARELGQDMRRIEFQEPCGFIRGLATYSSLKNRVLGIEMNDVYLMDKISESFSGKLYKGVWNGVPIVAKKLKVHNNCKRASIHMKEEFQKVRIFSHPNILPVLTAVMKEPNLITISHYLPYGSLYNIIHDETDIILDHVQAMKFALDIANGMAYFHGLAHSIKRYSLNSFHVMVDEDLTARLSMQDACYSFEDNTKVLRPNWMAPEALRNSPETIDQRSSDMWSYAIVLWELATREVPYGNLTAMEIGMKVAIEGCRPSLQPGMPSHLIKLISICWNSNPAKRPRFDQIIPILEKM